MLLTTLWQVGSIVVPPVVLSLLVTFSILYLQKYKEYLSDKDRYLTSMHFADLCKGYIRAQLAHQKCTQSKFWFWIFGSRYIDLVNLYTQRATYELDQLDQFHSTTHTERASIDYISFERNSFMSQWKELRGFLFKNHNEAHDDTVDYVLRGDLGSYEPFGAFGILVENKIYTLYKKQALYILRNKGYLRFSQFVFNLREESRRYPHTIPFSVIHRQATKKVIMDNIDEIAERMHNELKRIELEDSIDARKLALQELLKTYIISDFHFGPFARFKAKAEKALQREVVNT